MEKAKYNFGEFNKDTLTKPRDKAWQNWAKFEKVGDKVQGFIRDVFYRKEERDEEGDGFSAQRGITLEQPTGELINVGIKRLPFILDKTDTLRLGDPLTIVFESQLEPKKKGYKGAKQMAFYGKNLEENKDQKTVKELDHEDMVAGGTSDAENERLQKEFDAMTGEDEFPSNEPKEA